MARKKMLSFEEALLKIEEIVLALENEKMPLEESIALYKEGMVLSGLCKEKLAEAEGELLLLQKNINGTVIEKPFDLEGN